MLVFMMACEWLFIASAIRDPLIKIIVMGAAGELGK